MRLRPRCRVAGSSQVRLFAGHGYASLVGSELTFGYCKRERSPLLLVTAPRDTYERAGTGRKAGTSTQVAIRRGHFFSPAHAATFDAPPAALGRGRLPTMWGAARPGCSPGLQEGRRATR